MHPGLEGILVVPICPRSLSFRPLLVPSATALTISVDKGSRGELGVSIDGGEIELLQKEQSVSIHADLSLSESVYCVSRGSETADWVSHVNGLLGFNSMFGQLHNRST